MKLHDYQEQAVDFLQHRPSAGLFLDMGLGKTAIVLSALRPEDLPALVVAPKRVAERVWPAEREKWRPDLSMAVAAGTPAQRAAALAAGADVTVIGRDNVKEVQPGHRTVVLDELSGFKDRNTARWKAARRLTAKATNVWGLTGTPSPNGLLDLWAQVFLLDGGERLDTSLTRYRERYFRAAGRLPSGVVIDWEQRPEADANIHRKIEDICLYMDDSVLDLPPVTYNPISLSMPPGLRAQYREFKNELVLAIETVGDFSAANAAVLSGKLSQMCAGFLFSDEQDGTWTQLHQIKIDALREIREGTSDNLLVFYQYNPERDMILRAFPEARLLTDPGVLDEWDTGSVPIMLAHPSSSGHGLNLQHGGHTAVWASLTWDLEQWLQANKRLPRPGQRHPVIIHTLEFERSADTAKHARLDGKTSVQQALLDHVRSPI